MTTLAHLTDLHLPLHGGLRARELVGKRALSAANWRRSRRRTHNPDIAALVAEDIKALAPDHVAVSGDVVNFGLPREFEAGAAWLTRLGLPMSVSFVPGNHEAIHRGHEAACTDAFRPFTTGDDGDSGFPFLRVRGDIALIGVSSSIATAPLLAQGAVGPGQLAALAGVLRQTKGLARVVIIHHPPAGYCKPRKGLRDAQAFCAVLAAEGAELVLHGHNHRAQQAWIEVSSGPRIPVVGAPSASVGFGFKDDPAEWRLINVASAAKGFDIAIRRRRITRDGAVEDIGEVTLS